MTKIAVIGAGSWGTALASLAARAGHDVCVWARDKEVVEAINRDQRNPKHLSDVHLPVNLRAASVLKDAIAERHFAILAVPSHAIRTFLSEPDFRVGETILVGAAKGIEIETGKRISQVVNDVLGTEAASNYVAFSGPSFAREVLEQHPTAVVAASDRRENAELIQRELSFENLRVYTHDDLVGVELGGAVKNVIAIAAGMVAGLGYGSNSMAALVTRGLAEMTRLAMREGARVETLMGLAGLGDLVLTCTGKLSRNRYVGQELAKGRLLNQICAGMQEVAEGIKTTLAVKALSERAGVEMPITNEVHAVLYEAKSPSAAVEELMTRPLRGEFEAQHG